MDINKDTVYVRAQGRKRYVHVRGCSHITNWTIDGLEPVERFKPKKMVACPTCEKLIYISMGAKDYLKKIPVYNDIFKNVPLHIIKRLFDTENAKCQINATDGKLYIQTKQDRWYLDFGYTEKGQTVFLYHGNYKVNAREQGTSRDFWELSGYHEHNLKNENFNDRLTEALRQIAFYSYKEATKAHKKKRRAAQKVKQKFSELDAEYWGF